MFMTLPKAGENHQHPSVVEMVEGKPIAFPDSATTLPSDKPYVGWIVPPLGLIAHDNTLWGKRSGIDGIPDGAAKIVGIDIDSERPSRRSCFTGHSSATLSS
jgi:hypothetical protein